MARTGPVTFGAFVPQGWKTEPFDSWQAGNLVGTPEQVIERIGVYREMGVTSFMPWCRDYPATDTLRLVAERVMPAHR